MKTKLISLFFVVVFLFSCKTTERTTNSQTDVKSEIEKIYERYYSIKDSVVIRDSVVVLEDGTVKAKYKTTERKTSRIERYFVFFKIEKHIKEVRTITIRIPIEKKLSWWDRLYIGLGKLSAGILLILIGSVIVKSYTNPKDYLKNLLHNKK